MNKFIFIISFLIILSADVFAQFTIDLKNNNPVVSEPLTMGHPGPSGKEIQVNNLYMTIGGKPVLPVMGEFHFNRHDCRFWRDALLKMKSSGVNIVATYVIWNLHEEIEGRQDWTGNKDIRQFIELCDEIGLLVHLRAGPYCNAEIRNGGLPDWLRQKGARPRTNDPLYLTYARKWYKELYSQVEGLLYKDGGPIMALQIENEFVTENLLISHMLNLKRIATEEGFDVPIYSMTHWMSVNYPKGEIVPYAGYYIETPWINSGKNELPISNFQFFSYNRISDNIGTDIIKKSYDSESLSGEGNTSPYFTCEVGVGTPTFYYRRPIVSKEMAGANINLRLGCGVNLMGYYMYTGGTNPVGQYTTMESSTGRMSYDYQAPIREFGNLGAVMAETKKYNFFMNDFGADLVRTIAWLPTSNKDTSELQWAVRLEKDNGYLFCSNYLYKHPRREYSNVQFNIQLPDETLQIPRNPINIKNGIYFAWPFNQMLGGIKFKYATNQLICSHNKDNIQTLFFFAQEGIPSEYLIEDKNIKSINVSGGVVTKEKNQYLIHQLKPGKECVIEIKKDDKHTLRLITLTNEESHQIWKGYVGEKEVVAFSNSGVIFEDDGLTLFDEQCKQEVVIYESEFAGGNKIPALKYYTRYEFEDAEETFQIGFRKLSPMDGALRIASSGKVVQKEFNGVDFSSPASIILRGKLYGNAISYFNNNKITWENKGDYNEADVTQYFENGMNSIRFESEGDEFSVIAEAEVILKNGTRRVWRTDPTWITANRQPVKVVEQQGDIRWNENEKITLYEIDMPKLKHFNPEVRLNIGFTGDRADLFIGEKLVDDFLFDGADAIFGINRYRDQAVFGHLLVRLKGFDTADPIIYFEKGTSMENCTTPVIKHVKVKQEHRFKINL